MLTIGRGRVLESSVDGYFSESPRKYRRKDREEYVECLDIQSINVLGEFGNIC